MIEFKIFICGVAFGVAAMLVCWRWESARVHREWMAITDRALGLIRYYEKRVDELLTKDEADWWKRN